jgi:hypothetical protein
MPGTTGQPDAWLSRTSAPDDGGNLLPEGRFRQPAGLVSTADRWVPDCDCVPSAAGLQIVTESPCALLQGGGLPEPAFGFGGLPSQGLRHATGKLHHVDVLSAGLWLLHHGMQWHGLFAPCSVAVQLIPKPLCDVRTPQLMHCELCTAGSIDGLVAAFLPQATDMVPESPSV